MGLFSNLFRRKTDAVQVAAANNRTRQADAAIRGGRAGDISVLQMLRSVVVAQVFVPLAGPPVMDGDVVRAWKPATVVKQAGGAQFVVAFTDDALVRAFSEHSPEYSFVLLVEVRWVLDVLPQGHGLAFNLGAENAFEWTAEGITAYRAEHG